ncbi:DUF1800 domain-containing protein [Actibacterium lipolyticum]|uniref:DUF1800 domain-containing protein n=1 Tax=Actibacterium lipolyticum TaxID=1524263 RepID=A0A238JMS7_9RHOB|nr:DUF1800 domain-containing protein [Actibacterium lipolyticum]SMX31795.1 hypothetical protein COL8621_00608 [Actibacterium lipolyticum]
MMKFTDLAEVRFGTGISVRRSGPKDVDDILRRLQSRDDMAARHPIDEFKEVLPVLWEIRKLQKVRKEKKDSPEGLEALTTVRDLRKTARDNQQHFLNAAFRRSIDTTDGFRERLTRFWADHFTVKGKTDILRNSVSTYVEEAIRPNMTGSFGALLKAATTHVMMLNYLDQATSAGPNSKAALATNRGMNENLAREVIELHTLGVDADYSQTDVHELAKLFTGMSFTAEKGFLFRPYFAEPGALSVLGNTYGSDTPKMDDIYAVLDDLAVHPATAHHITRKIATHFVSDHPDEALLTHMVAAYTGSGGDLLATYAAMLEHPSAWAPTLSKVRQPFDFVAASLRALDIPSEELLKLDWKRTRALLNLPMRVMGQNWENPTGPDGWPEAAEEWVTPQGMAGRIQWAMSAPALLSPALPDPRVFVDSALGGAASGDLRFAANAAETRAIGIGLILSSPDFQRR